MTTNDKSAPDRIWAMAPHIGEYFADPPVTPEDKMFLTEYVRADRASAPRPVVKPLVWRGPYSCNGYRKGEYKAAEYSVQREGESQWRVFRNLIERRETVFRTLDEAKAAAQADYESHILAALDPAPVSVSEAAKVFRDLITSAKMLQQNAEGCAVNHYGDDFHLHGMPGWLADTKASIEAAERALATEGDG